ncbi:MAG: hypothetical protein OM95_07820 [Bdellovibrio sp. ArHS]|uniref:hypothetical protein n=1 Tax=Bdellovibrio sp. ArHS TaxID=1569284 RepID=UPI0005825C92|nr:hypothetical protein [Bdellovibrio sp. ArHS]KHD88700.1 MAG: hypothetical protein OM95_07820 [Bdellovibrio sp. ArHS]
MIKFVLTLATLSVLFASGPAVAFVSAQEEQALIAAINDVSPAHIRAESLRCSLRNRMCLVHMEIAQRKAGCMIERISDVSDLYTEEFDKETGKNFFVLSRYAQDSLAHCVNQLSR